MGKLEEEAERLDRLGFCYRFRFRSLFLDVMLFTCYCDVCSVRESVAPNKYFARCIPTCLINLSNHS
jgi:hypothetical protein